MDSFAASWGRQRLICSLAILQQLGELKEDLGGKDMSDRVKKVQKVVPVY